MTTTGNVLRVFQTLRAIPDRQRQAPDRAGVPAIPFAPEKAKLRGLWQLRGRDSRLAGLQQHQELNPGLSTKDSRLLFKPQSGV